MSQYLIMNDSYLSDVEIKDSIILNQNDISLDFISISNEISFNY